MKKTVTLIFCTLLSLALGAQRVERYSRVEVLLGDRTLGQLAAAGIEADHGELRPGYSLTTDLSESELLLVQAAGFQTRVVIADVQAWYKDPTRQPAAAASRGAGCESPTAGGNFSTPANYTYGSMGGYHTYQELLDVLDTMAARFPALISQRAIVSDTILTHEGRPLWYVKISDNPTVDEAEPEVLYTSLHHAREPNGMSQMLFYIWYLLENYATDERVRYIVDHGELHFVPCVNPDGYIRNETTDPDGGGLWRKNRRFNVDSTYGVDLNRNYGYQWGYNNQGSSPNPGSDVYRGPEGFSEPETRSMRDFSREHEFQLALNYHTYGNLFIYPWSYSDMVADSAMVVLANWMTRENHYHAGTTSETVGYSVNGSSDDWMYGETGIFAYTPEVSQSGFWPSPDEIDGLNKDNVWANLGLALASLRYGEASDRSSVFIPQLQSDLPYEVIRYGAEDGPLTVSLTPLTANVLSVSPPVAVDLDRFETLTGSFAVTLAPSTVAGEAVEFLLRTDNGFFVHTDTLRKVFAGSVQAVFTENGTNLAPFAGPWGTTQATFVSPPSSITDSPVGNYQPSTVSVLEMTNPVLIPAGAIRPHLRFYARWELEENYDYVMVTAANNNQYVELCGRYTEAGNGNQPFGSPVIDGAQYEWVEECMDLSAFAGQPVTISFILGADGGVSLDGFYFDDLEIAYLDSTISAVVTVPLEDFRLLPNQPNPATDYTLLRWENRPGLTGTAELRVFDALGRPVYRQDVSLAGGAGQLKLDTGAWVPGVYTYYFQWEDRVTAPMKMTILK